MHTRIILINLLVFTKQKFKIFKTKGDNKLYESHSLTSDHNDELSCLNDPKFSSCPKQSCFRELHLAEYRYDRHD
jgi:hypothetical protein